MRNRKIMSRGLPELISGKLIPRRLYRLLLLPALTAQLAFATPGGPKQAPGGGTAGVQEPGGDHQELEEGKPIARELSGGSVHSYRVRLGADQYLYVTVDQRGIDVIVKLFGPDGKLLKEVDSPNGTEGPEPVSALAGMPGYYRLEVISLDKDAPAGRYEVRIEELRAVAPETKKLIADAESASERGAKLTDEKTDASRLAAIKEFQESARLWREAGIRGQEARAMGRIAYTYFVMGDYQMAIESYRQQQLLWRALGDPTGEAQALTDIGGIHTEMGRFREALPYYEQALPLRRAAKNPRGEAVTLNNIGVVYEALGERQKALEIYEQVLPLRQSANDSIGRAITLTNIGRILADLGEFQRALDLFYEALPVFQKSHNPAEEADVRLNIGRVHLYIGHYPEALESFLQALSIQERENTLYWKEVSLNNIGVVLEAMGENGKALEYYERALKLQQRPEGQGGDKRGQAHSYNNMGRVYGSLGQYQKALEYHQKALTLMREVGDRRGEATTLNRIGSAYAATGDVTRAQESYSQALAISLPSRDRPSEAGVRYNLARLARARGNFKEARGEIESALEIIKSLGTAIANRKLRESFFASSQKYYEFYIDLLMQAHRREAAAGHDLEAFNMSEQSRARSLLELLAGADIDARSGVEPSLIEKERAAAQRLNNALENQIRLLSRNHTKEQVEAVARELDALTTEYEHIQGQIRRSSPRYAALKAPEPLSLQDLRQRVLDEDTLLLEYFLGEERAYLWAVTDGSFHSFELRDTAREIKASAAAIIDALARTGGTVRALETSAGAMGVKLFPPEVVRQLRRKKRVVIVANGVLQYLPFAVLALPAGAGNYRPLISDHELVSLQSASTVWLLRQQTGGRRTARNELVIFADPVFSTSDERLQMHPASSVGDAPNLVVTPASAEVQEDSQERMARLLARKNESSGGKVKLSRLKRTQDEAGIIKDIVPSARVYSGFDANLARATSPETGTYRILHFATHGIAPDGSPDLPGVVLSLVDERGGDIEGYLGLPRVYNMSLSADLVVLSACETGLGKDVQGEGLVGLTRGFMHAGSPRVVSSLWRVQDDATKELMRRFYTAIFKDGMRPAAALSAAQAAMWAERRWSPSDWAGFVFFGEWR